MILLSLILTVTALLATALVYGTDVFCALVLCPALAHPDHRARVAASSCPLNKGELS